MTPHHPTTQPRPERSTSSARRPSLRRLHRAHRGSNRRRDRGSVTLELSILTPAMILLIGFAVVAGRVAIGNSSVTTIAGNAARQASLARDAHAATAAATTAARTDLAAQGLKCAGGGTVHVDTTGFAAATRGQPGQAVTVTIDCLVSFSDLAMPGLPGSRTLTERAVSPIDPNRSRTSLTSTP